MNGRAAPTPRRYPRHGGHPSEGVRTAKRLPADGTDPELGANAVDRLNNGDVDGYITALYHPHRRDR